jgi:hypothetical protein
MIDGKQYVGVAAGSGGRHHADKERASRRSNLFLTFANRKTVRAGKAGVTIFRATVSMVYEGSIDMLIGQLVQISIGETVLRPVDAGGYQRDGAGVHHMNDATKTPCQSFTPTSDGKSRRKLLEVGRAPPRTAVQPAQRPWSEGIAPWNPHRSRAQVSERDASESDCKAVGEH